MPKKEEKRRKIRIKKENLYSLIALLIIIFGIVFIYKTIVKIKEEKTPVLIDLNQYREATFSDSFSSQAWIDAEETTMVFNEKELSFVCPATEKRGRQIVSTRVNFEVNKILAAQITKSENKTVNSLIKYYFSNDHGLNWEKAEIGHITYFKNSGNELKWKAEVLPIEQRESLSIEGSSINSIYLKYWYEK